jgi:hypothetical protein
MVNSMKHNTQIDKLESDFNTSKPGDSGFDFSAVENWWPKSVGDASDLPDFTGLAWRHVLYGDDDGSGGHIWHVVKSRGIQHKTAFPITWGVNEIGLAAATVLRKSAAKQNIKANCLPPNSDHEELVEIDDSSVLVFVTLDYAPDGSAILTVFPRRGDNVYKLQDKTMIPVPLLKSEK